MKSSNFLLALIFVLTILVSSLHFLDLLIVEFFRGNLRSFVSLKQKWFITLSYALSFFKQTFLIQFLLWGSLLWSFLWSFHALFLLSFSWKQVLPFVQFHLYRVLHQSMHFQLLTTCPGVFLFFHCTRF